MECRAGLGKWRRTPPVGAPSPQRQETKALHSPGADLSRIEEEEEVEEGQGVVVEEGEGVEEGEVVKEEGKAVEEEGEVVVVEEKRGPSGPPSGPSSTTLNRAGPPRCPPPPAPADLDLARISCPDHRAACSEHYPE
ncbi:unnamed protein product [Gadus morhua 'NCC']